MLHHYAFSNFQSFRERTVVSLELNQKSAVHGWQVVSPAGQRLSTVLAVMGANGAGKTAALKPLAFVDWFLKHSFASAPDAVIPVVPHLLSPRQATEFEVEAEDSEGVTWRYELAVTPARVEREALYRKQERFGYVFVREWDEASQGYAVKQQGFGLLAAEARKVRPNASLVSTAAQYGVELAGHLSSMWMTHNMTVEGRAPFARQQLATAAQFFHGHPALRSQMARLLASWDLGLSDVLVQRSEIVNVDGSKGVVWSTLGTHSFSSGVFHMPLELESNGTQSAFVLLSRLLPVLANGGLAVLDELDSDLHPHMLEPILDLFANPATNPNRGQLIFTCHTPEVLDLLQKSQVLIVNKDDGASEAYRADEVKGLRSDDNLRAKYMAGALGGVPQL